MDIRENAFSSRDNSANQQDKYLFIEEIYGIMLTYLIMDVEKSQGNQLDRLWIPIWLF